MHVKLRAGWPGPSRRRIPCNLGRTPMDDRETRRLQFEEVERRLMAILRAATPLLPREKLEYMESLAVDHGEYRVALEDFCEHVFDGEVKLPESMVTEIAELATMMRMPLPEWIGNDSWIPPIN